MSEINPEQIETREDFFGALNMLAAEKSLTARRLAEESKLPHVEVANYLFRGRLPDDAAMTQIARSLGVDPESWIAARDRVEGPSRYSGGFGNFVHFPDEGRGVIRAGRDLYQAEQYLVASSDDLELGLLWEVTHKRLDYYHAIATNQAKVSFRNAQVAMAVGFVFLVGFAFLALYARTTTISIVTGALGAVGAAFAGFISRTFVQSQQSSAAHLRSYFDQPVELSRYLAAERVISSMKNLGEEQRAQLARDLVQGIVSLPSTAERKDAKGE